MNLNELFLKNLYWINKIDKIDKIDKINRINLYFTNIITFVINFNVNIF
jgi:hypothetical protein